MSLTSTYVRAVDGLFYKDPIIYGENYFICFDDDDPPEIVIANSSFDLITINNLAIKILKELGIKFIIVGEILKSTRFFPPYKGVKNKWANKKKATIICFQLLNRIPIPTEHDGAYISMNNQGVYLDP